MLLYDQITTNTFYKAQIQYKDYDRNINSYSTKGIIWNIIAMFKKKNVKYVKLNVKSLNPTRYVIIPSWVVIGILYRPWISASELFLLVDSISC